MRAGRIAWFTVNAAVGVVVACSKAPAPGEDVMTSAGPPIVICYEPDGAPCPLPPDAGDDGAENRGPADASQPADASDAGG